MIARRAVALGLTGVVATCGYNDPVAPRSPTSDKPKLVVLLVLDQWPEWAFEVKRPALTGGGFDRLLAEGSWQIGEHPSASTLTAPGHALLSTGAPPCASGVIANEWYHRDIRRKRQSVEGPRGNDATWLRVPGLGDAVSSTGRAGKAVAASLKARSAILMLGHAGLPVWYQPKTAEWVTSEAPGWLIDHNAKSPLAAKIHAPWTPLDPAKLAALSGIPDGNAGELGEKKLDGTFPHEPDATGDPAEALFSTPTGNTVLFELGLAAIEGEQLGRDDEPDLLAISLSAHDYIGHGWGHESWESWDATLRLDRELAQFLAALDSKIGVGQWAMIVTSDHGASPVPERVGSGGRITYEHVQEVANRGAESVLGAGTWVADAKYPTVFFTPELLASPKRDEAIAAVRRDLLALPGIALAEPTSTYAGNCAARTGDAKTICASLDVERSGELVYLTKPHWFMHEADEPTATAHGSLHPYDRRVPLVILPPGRAKHAPLAKPDGTVVPMTEVAPTLARWLGVTLVPPKC